MYTVFVKLDGEWQPLAWDQTKQEARKLVLSCTLMHDTQAEYRPQ